MSSISVDYDVLNQKGSPAWYSDTFANIPTPGYKGRMFISIDTFAFYRDNGTGWDLVGGPGTGTITGAGVSGQVTYFIGTDTIGGNNNLFYDITNSRLGIGTATPGAPLDIHSTGTAAQFNGTGVNNSFLLFQNAGTSKWRIGNLYNSGANDYQIFDVTNSTARLTIKNTGASTLIGTFTATSLIKSGGTNLQILLADGSTTPTSTFGAGSVTNVSALTLGTTGVDLSSSVANSTTTPVITLNVPTASATNRGALSSADWTTFNSKQATITLTTTGTSGAATLVGATLNIPNYTNVGTVTSVAALTLGTTGTDLSSSVANSTTTPVITLNVPTASGTNRGALSSADWTTFNNKQSTISVTAPVVLTGATISMPAATTSVNGYLTSTDWNTFNNKTSNLGTVTNVVALTIGTTGIDITSTAVTTTTTPVITLNIPTASASNRGALSSTDWSTFNSKVSGSGTTGYIPKFVSASGLGNSTISESGFDVNIQSNTTTAGFSKVQNGLYVGYAFAGAVALYSVIYGATDGIQIGLANGTGGGRFIFQTAAAYNYTLPAATGTLALTSDLGGYLPLSGGTLTGALNGTSASFSSTITAVGYSKFWNGTAGFLIGVFTGGGGYGALYNTGITPSNSNFTIAANGLSTVINATNDISLVLNNGSFGYFLNSARSLISVATNQNIRFSSETNTAIQAINDAASAYVSLKIDGFNLLLNSQSGGNIGINTISPQSSYKVTISGTDTIFPAIYLENTTNSQAYSIRASGTNFAIRDNSSGNDRFTIANTGAATFGSTIQSIGQIVFSPTLGYVSTSYQSYTGAQTWYVGAGNSGVSIQPFFIGTNANGNSPIISISASTSAATFSSRGNFLGATDNALFSLNSGGTLYTVGFSPTATASSTNTLTLTTGQTTYIYTGTGTASWTLPNPSGTNQMFWIKNAGTGIITLNAFAGTNIINNAAASVSSITIAVGATALIQQDGNVKSYQLQ